MSPEKSALWYQKTQEDLLTEFVSDLKSGLAGGEVAKRQKHYGKNVFERHKKVTVLHRILTQLKNPLVLVLLGAGVATILLGEYTNAIVIGIALAINVIIGVFQEERAFTAFDRLAKSQERTAVVIREGRKSIVQTEELVPGDIIELSAGMYVPADVRILIAQDLSTNEATLTGEWVPVTKDSQVIAGEAPLSEQGNMAWMGTLVATGTGQGIVIATGNKTQIGVIAQSLGEKIDESTPLQKSIHRLATFLMYVILGVLALILIVGLARGYELFDLIFISIAIAVAAMPEGLPVAVTVVLAIGMESILKKGGLVRNLLAAETLGGTTIILTDKTGTLTKAQMQVAEIITLATLLEEPTEQPPGDAPTAKQLKVHADGLDALKMAILTSDAFVENEGEALADWVVRGRPVEKAIMTAGIELGLSQKDLLHEYARVDYLPFNPERRFAGSLHSLPRKKMKRFYVTGAPEFVLEHAKSAYRNGKSERLTKEKHALLARAHHAYSKKGMRLIGVGYKDISDEKIDEKAAADLDGFVFGGFIAMHDPLRADVPAAIKIVQNVGTRVVMATGDNPETALAIAREAGIAHGEEKAILGKDLEALNDEDLLATIKKHSVFARVLPEHKLRLARLLRGNGEVVAMTGDGVNDAPALRNADIGLALGSGTEVAKDASDIILLDDSFSVITSAIEEGRRIRDNLKKIITYLLSTSFSEIVVVTVALFLGKPLPLLPSQILWTKIVEEGFMNFAFAFEPLEPESMKKDPREHSMKEIVTQKLKKLIFLVAGMTGIFLGVLYLTLDHLGTPIDELRTLMFIAVSIDSIFFAFAMKNLHQPLWKIKLSSNRYLLGALSFSILALLLALVTPALQHLLTLAAPTYITVLAVLLFGTINLTVVEISKYIVFRMPQKKAG